MNEFKSHFVFNRSQQNGIFLLVAIIIILQFIYFFLGFPSENNESTLDEEDLRVYQSQIDSLKLAATAADSVTIYPFNPNYITDFKGYTLGMNLEEIDKLHNFREKGEWINSVRDFKKVTGVPDSLLHKISPFFKFPDWVIANQNKEAKTTLRQKSLREKKDLNAASIQDLQGINGVGETLSARIVNYRTKLGGFIHDIQLKDIYGLNYETREKILLEFAVKEKPKIEILSINQATILELAEIPYFDYELAREIADYRLLYEGIETFEELSVITSFPSGRIDRIKLYLTLD